MSPTSACSSRACAEMVKPGGIMFVATINRTLKALGLAIVGAEYVLRWLPRGTHQYGKLVRPDELEKALAKAGMTIADRTGVIYNPLADRWQRSKDMDVNYMVLAEKRRRARRGEYRRSGRFICAFVVITTPTTMTAAPAQVSSLVALAEETGA